MLFLLIVQSQIFKTGGGQVEHQSTSISNKVMGMMGSRFQSIENAYDCDGDFPGTLLPTNNVETFDISEIQRDDGDSPICKLYNSLN